MTEKIPVKILEPGTEKLEVYGRDYKSSDLSKTVELYQSSKKIYVKKISGFFQKIRNYTLWCLLIFYFSVCWISINGQQLLHFDLPGRQFHIYGITFWPQDFFLLAFLLIISAFALFFVTTLFGRMWCGYTCPQTAWTFIYMWIEEKVEGSRNQRMKLDKEDFSIQKFTKKLIKHAIWILVALATGITFVGYFYPMRELVPDLFAMEIADNWATFWIMFFTLATYINAGWLREQVCLYMCPYARFQSVMYDENTLAVSYNKERGDPRGSRKRNIERKDDDLGDCVDCRMCVQVCPTGIDIRDGLQYECIGCAICIDACDAIMDKMNYQKGLISYTTKNTLEGRESKHTRPKSIAYAVSLVLMTMIFSYFIATRTPLALDVMKDRGALFQLNGLGKFENSYVITAVNMTDIAHDFQLLVSGIDGIKFTTSSRLRIEAGEVFTLPTTLEVDPKNMQTSAYPIIFELIADDDKQLQTTSESRFLGSVY